MRASLSARLNPLSALNRSPQLRRWLAAAAIALTAIGLQWALRPLLGDTQPFVTFLPAIVLAAAVGGRGPAGLTLLAGLLSAWWWLPPVDGLRATVDVEAATLLLYVLMGLALIEFGAWLRRTLQRARDAEARLITAIEGTGIGVFEIDLVSRTAYVSPALARLTGLPAAPQAQPLKRWLELLPAELAAHSRKVVAEQLRLGARKYEREVQLPRGDRPPAEGGALWLLLRVHIGWAQGRATRLRGACIDISERKAVDAQLAQARAELSQQVDDLGQLHELSSRLPEAGSLQRQLQMILRTLAQFHGSQQGLVWLLDEDGRRLHVEAGIGFDAQVLPGPTDIDLGHGASGLVCAARERVVIEDAFADPRFEAFRDLARAHGFRAVHSTPLFGQHGQVLGAISVHLATARQPSDRETAVADICARKAAVFVERARAQSALDESQDRFRAVLEASAVPFVVLAPQRATDGGIADFSWAYMNSAAGQAVGRNADQLRGKLVGQLMPRWHDGVAFKQFVQAVHDGRAREFELQARLRQAGDEGWLHCIASPMRDGSLAVWFNDITERKEAERLLHEADRRKDEFLATLAHELRNPLAPIRQAAQLSNAPGASAEQQRWSRQVINRQVQHMALLLDDLLDVSRITRGVLQLRKTRADLGAVVASAVETARPAIDDQRHTLQLQLPSEPVYFYADPLRVAQVVANLLTNAAKYTPPGGIIDLQAQRAGGQILIEVSDNGVGIATESLPEVFRMFSQLLTAASDGTHGGSGLGIGLALSKGLVELHGGSIVASSGGPGCGSRFSVRLPAAEAAATDPPPAADSSAPAAGSVARRKVLIADDNRDAADTLAALLQLEGHEIELSFDGDQALSAYRGFGPDVCLFDIGMPGQSGYELARTIRALPGGQRPLLIAITGWGQDSDRQQALQAGFDHHLTKPVDPQQLAELIVAGG